MASTQPSTSLNNIRLVWPGGRSEQVILNSIGKSGGAGEVFEIAGKPDYVAKLYHQETRKQQLIQYESKIRWMLSNKPDLPEIPEGHSRIVQLAWPVAMVQKNSRFAGFVMEKIDFDRTLELDYLLTRKQAEAEGFEVDFGKLVAVCYNLATLIDCLHNKKIAVVDLKPINLKIYKSELFVSILDCDGFQIYSGSFVSEAPQITPEYLAPEFHDKAVTNPEAQDHFALATIIFRLLNYGIHPFTGVAASSQHHHLIPQELAGRIRHGLYPYGRKQHKHVRSAPASVHECLPDSIRELFDRSFSSDSGSRATAHEWVEVLGRYASRSAAQMVVCEDGHLHFVGMSCPTCYRDSLISGHVARRKRFINQIRATQARAFKQVKNTIRGTNVSPFQAALAQQPLNPLPVRQIQGTIRNAVSIEIIWILGLIISFWWMK